MITIKIVGYDGSGDATTTAAARVLDEATKDVGRAAGHRTARPPRFTHRC